MKMFLTFAAAFLATVSFSPALAETTECTEITTVPTTISAQGIYCLKQNLGTNITSGFAISVATNNVTIDMNGFKLGGLAAGFATTTTGIDAINRKNITIRNGNIRGFLAGIRFTASLADASTGHLVEDVLVDQARGIGILIAGSDSIIRNNRIVDLEDNGTADAAGIVVVGSDFLVEGNLIASLSSTFDEVTGILVDSATATEVSRNSIMNLTSAGAGPTGIAALGTDDVVLLEDYVASDNGLAGFGILGGAATDTFAIRNIVSNFGGIGGIPNVSDNIVFP